MTTLQDRYWINMLPWVRCCSWGSRWLTGQTCHTSGCLGQGWGSEGGAPHNQWWCEEGRRQTTQTHRGPNTHTHTHTHTQTDKLESCDKLLKHKQEVIWNSHLDRNEDEGDNELGGGADEFWRSHRPLALFKDAVDAVGFGQHGGVGDGHTKA